MSDEAFEVEVRCAGATRVELDVPALLEAFTEGGGARFAHELREQISNHHEQPYYTLRDHIGVVLAKMGLVGEDDAPEPLQAGGVTIPFDYTIDEGASEARWEGGGTIRVGATSIQVNARIYHEQDSILASLSTCVGSRNGYDQGDIATARKWLNDNLVDIVEKVQRLV